MAARFWVAQPVSGAVVSVSSPPQIRLTVSSTTGMTTGDVRTVFGVGGTTEANGTWTITVIDGTHIDLQGTTFTNVYTSGGSVNGLWNGTNTNNWVTTSGGTNYGQTVPGSGDTVTLDGASGGGTVTPNTTVTVQSITCGAFGGTLDFSANDNNVTLSTAFDGSGTGARTINLGDGTWTMSGTATAWNMATITNLVAFNANGSTLTFTGGGATFAGGGRTYNVVNFNNGASGIFTTGSNTFATLGISAPNFVIFSNGTTATITNGFTFAGTPTSPIALVSSNSFAAATISVPSGTPTLNFGALRAMTFSGGATFTANNSLNLGVNTGITINGPSGGVTGVIGG